MNMSLRPAQPRTPALLTIKDVAEHLKLSTKTVRRMIDAGKLPSRRLGRLIRVAPDDLATLVHLAREMPGA
jgi:excisionase family DNA binding protein